MKHRIAVVALLAALTACEEAPTEPVADFVEAPSFSLASSSTDIVITFDDPDGVYAPGDVVEKGFRVWMNEADGWKFGVHSWYGDDPDNEINLGNNGRIVYLAAEDNSPFTLLSFFASSLRTRTAGITVRGYDAAGTLVISTHVDDPYPGGQYALPTDFSDLTLVTFQSSGGGAQGNHSLDDLTILGGPANPETMDDCKNGGWEQYGFKNQGQCIRFVQTGKDSR